MAETWRAIPGYEGFYEASNLGRIRSLDRVSGGGGRHYRGRILKTPVKTTGYFRFNVTRGARVLPMTVHRAVCRAFHGEGPAGQEVRHLNGDKLDNRAENLAWGTRLENMADAVGHGTMSRGEHRPRARLTECAVRNIKAALTANPGKIGLSVQLAGMHGVSRGCIDGIKSGRLWKHV